LFPRTHEMCYTWDIHTWQVYVQTSVIFKHLTQVSVVTLRSDLERKGEGKKTYRNKRGRGEGRSAQIFRNPRSDLKILGARTTQIKLPI
jgi:hypothetical protein